MMEGVSDRQASSIQYMQSDWLMDPSLPEMLNFSQFFDASNRAKSIDPSTDVYTVNVQ